MYIYINIYKRKHVHGHATYHTGVACAGARSHARVRTARARARRVASRSGRSNVGEALGRESGILAHQVTSGTADSRACERIVVRVSLRRRTPEGEDRRASSRCRSLRRRATFSAGNPVVQVAPTGWRATDWLGVCDRVIEISAGTRSLTTWMRRGRSTRGACASCRVCR